MQGFSARLPASTRFRMSWCLRAHYWTFAGISLSPVPTKGPFHQQSAPHPPTPRRESWTWLMAKFGGRTAWASRHRGGKGCSPQTQTPAPVPHPSSCHHLSLYQPLCQTPVYPTAEHGFLSPLQCLCGLFFSAPSCPPTRTGPHFSWAPGSPQEQQHRAGS